MFDLAKIKCLGDFYILYIGNTKERIFLGLWEIDRKTLDSYFATLIILLTLQVFE